MDSGSTSVRGVKPFVVWFGASSKFAALQEFLAEMQENDEISGLKFIDSFEQLSSGLRETGPRIVLILGATEHNPSLVSVLELIATAGLKNLIQGVMLVGRHDSKELVGLGFRFHGLVHLVSQQEEDILNFIYNSHDRTNRKYGGTYINPLMIIKGLPPLNNEANSVEAEDYGFWKPDVPFVFICDEEHSYEPVKKRYFRGVKPGEESDEEDALQEYHSGYTFQKEQFVRDLADSAETVVFSSSSDDCLTVMEFLAPENSALILSQDVLRKEAEIFWDPQMQKKIAGIMLTYSELQPVPDHPLIRLVTTDIGDAFRFVRNVNMVDTQKYKGIYLDPTLDDVAIYWLAMEDGIEYRAAIEEARKLHESVFTAPKPFALHQMIQERDTRKVTKYTIVLNCREIDVQEVGDYLEKLIATDQSLKGIMVLGYHRHQERAFYLLEKRGLPVVLIENGVTEILKRTLPAVSISSPREFAEVQLPDVIFRADEYFTKITRDPKQKPDVFYWNDINISKKGLRDMRKEVEKGVNLALPFIQKFTVIEGDILQLCQHLEDRKNFNEKIVIISKNPQSLCLYEVEKLTTDLAKTRLRGVMFLANSKEEAQQYLPGVKRGFKLVTWDWRDIRRFVRHYSDPSYRSFTGYTL